MQKREFQKIIAGLLIVLGTLVLSGILQASPLFDVFGKKLTHGLYSPRETAKEIVIVAIDDESIKGIQDGGLGPFASWPKGFMAEAIENIREDGAHSMFVDIIYNSPSSSISYGELNEASSEIRTASDLGNYLVDYLSDINPQDRLLVEALDQDVFLLESASDRSLDLFTDQGRSVSATIDPDGNEQAVYTVSLEEQLALTMAEGFLDDLNLSDSIPVDSRGQMLINYASLPYSFPSISFKKCLCRGF